MTVFNNDGLGALRPLADADLQMVLKWRNRPAVRANMYTQHEITLAEHTAWWTRTKDRKSDRYFIFESASQPCGLVSFNELNLDTKTSFWAFYAAPDAPKGSGTRMEFLALDYYFQALQMRKLSCEVLAFNKPVLNLHRKFGFQQEGCFTQHALVDGSYIDVHRLALFADRWQKDRDKIHVGIMKRISQ